MVSLSCNVVDSIKDINENQWNNLVSQSELGTVFHRAGWLRSIEEGLDYEPKHVIVRKNGNPVAACPNFVSKVDMPFELPIDVAKLGFAQLASVTPGFGGPLITGNRKQSLGAIFNAIEEASEWNSIVHRMRILDPTHIQYAQSLRARNYTPSLLYCRLWLPLDDYQRILDEMDKERRKEIRKAKANDSEVVEEDVTRESMRDFYTEYRKTIERTDGTRYPFSFFEALATHLGDRIEIFTAVVDGQPVGKHLYLRDDEQNSLHYFFAGVDERYFEYSSPTLLHDYAIRWGIDNGYSTYDFGGTSSNYQDGVFEYKRKFGSRIEPVYEWERGQSTIRWKSYRAARKRHLKETIEELFRSNVPYFRQ